MKIKSLFVTLAIAMLLLSACGSNSPSATKTGVVNGNAPAITLTVMFPPKPLAYTAPNALISASTNQLNITVTGISPAVTYGTGTIIAPPAGGIASTTILLGNTSYYQTPSFQVNVDIVGQTSTLVQTGAVRKTMTVTVSSTTAVSIPFVEYEQGVANITGVTMTAPDGIVYTLNSLFLSPYYNPNTWSYYYEMGLKATDPFAQTAYHYSTLNVATDPSNINLVSFIDNASTTFSVTAMASGGVIWNKYDINFNFAPGGVPGNTPTITGTFIGTFTYDIASATVVPASGTAGTNFTITNASWANNVAPPPPTVPITVF